MLAKSSSAATTQISMRTIKVLVNAWVRLLLPGRTIHDRWHGHAAHLARLSDLHGCIIAGPGLPSRRDENCKGFLERAGGGASRNVFQYARSFPARFGFVGVGLEKRMYLNLQVVLPIVSCSVSLDDPPTFPPYRTRRCDLQGVGRRSLAVLAAWLPAW